MTTRTTAIEASKPSTRALIGSTLATLALLGGVLIWQGRDSSEATPPDAITTITGTGEGVTPRGGLAEHYREMLQGVAGDAAPPAGVPALTAGAGRYFTAPGATAAPVTTMGGLAELYRDHAALPMPAGRMGDVSRCGFEVEQVAC